MSSSMKYTSSASPTAGSPAANRPTALLADFPTALVADSEICLRTSLDMTLSAAAVVSFLRVCFVTLDTKSLIPASPPIPCAA